MPHHEKEEMKMRSAVEIKERKNFYDVLLINFFCKNKKLFEGKKSEVVRRLMNKFSISRAWAYRLLKRLEDLGFVEFKED